MTVTGIRPVVAALRTHRVAILLVAVGTLARIQALNDSINESYAFRQTQTALVIRQFIRGGFDARTPLPVFGPDSLVPFEFPAFQHLASLVARALEIDAGTAGRLTSLVWFQIACVAGYLIARRTFGTRAGFVALVLGQALPFGLQWGVASLIEFMPVALMLVAVAALLRRPTPAVIFVASLVTALAALIKVTTFVTLAPMLLLVILAQGEGGLRTRVRTLTLRSVAAVALPSGSGLVAAALWTSFADRVKAGQASTAWLTSSALRTWNFGTLDQRLDPEVIWSMASDWASIIPFAVLPLLLIPALLHTTKRLEFAAVGLAAVTGPLLFTNLYFVHNYYYSAVFLPIVILTAASIGEITSLTVQRTPGRAGAPIAIALTVVILLAGQESSIARGHLQGWWRGERAAPGAAAVIARLTPADGVVITVGCDWNPTLAYFSDRPFHMIRPPGTVLPVGPEDVPGAAAVYFCGGPGEESESVLARDLPGFRAFATEDPNLYLLRAD